MNNLVISQMTYFVMDSTFAAKHFRLEWLANFNDG